MVRKAAKKTTYYHRTASVDVLGKTRASVSSRGHSLGHIKGVAITRVGKLKSFKI